MPIEHICKFCFRFTKMDIIRKEDKTIINGIVTEYVWFKCEHCGREWMDRDVYDEDEA